MRYLWMIAAVIMLITGNILISNAKYKSGLATVPRCLPPCLQTTYEQLHTIADSLHSYKKQHGSYPSMDQGLSFIGRQIKDKGSEAAFLKFGSHPPHVAANGTLLTLWEEPFIYENRNGLPPGAFSESGASSDLLGEYSIEVDKGFYVWSVGAKRACELRDQLNRHFAMVENGVFGASVLCVAAFVWTCRRRLDPEVHGRARGLAFAWSITKGLLVAAGSFFAGIFFLSLTIHTCYERATMIRPWDSKTSADYTAIMRKYRDKGIISNTAYSKLLQALNEDHESPKR